MAESSQPSGAYEVGAVQEGPQALSSPARTRRSQHLPACSEALDQRAGCGKSASPDLWEPPVSNHRGQPDRTYVERVQDLGRTLEEQIRNPSVPRYQLQFRFHQGEMLEIPIIV